MQAGVEAMAGRFDAVPARNLYRIAPPRVAAATVHTVRMNLVTQARDLYLRGNKGQPFGRPPIGNPSKYLLTNLVQ